MRFRDSPEIVVDLDAIEQNFAVVKLLVGTAVAISAVVKSDAYGLGIDEILDPLLAAGCRSFFVANVCEALLVRERLRAAEVFILEAGAMDEKGVYDLAGFIPVCNNMADVDAASLSHGSYAINLDTGFSRFGLSFPELREVVHRKLPAPALVMSHLACADDPVSIRNQLQKNRFVQMCGLIPSAPRSLAASAGISLGTDYHFERVRIGSALYGLNNAGLDPNPFASVVSLRARIADVRLVHAGETVGYMGTFRASRPTWLGIVAIGYAHGLAWSLSNRASAEIGSYLAPLAGRIAMEYAAIDLTDVPATLHRPGLWVDLVNSRLPLEAMARAASTVPQEVLLRLGASSRRFYLRNRARGDV
ncbi:alanine racemase [Rhizobium sp. 2YAF20]|uniref:alanine racemase n=1 Tax=Rhizobium sp. 2YAF20 TaxID=3233027 RepID=UPI003F9C1C0C